jgi:hypothetical protein
MRSGYFIQCYDRLRHRRRAFRRVIRAVTGEDLPVEHLRAALLTTPPGSRPFERARQAVSRLLAAVESGQLGFYRITPAGRNAGRRAKSLESVSVRGIVTVPKETAG